MQLQRPATRFAVSSESKMSFLRELVSLLYTVQYSAEGEYVEDTEGPPAATEYSFSQDLEGARTQMQEEDGSLLNE